MSIEGLYNSFAPKILSEEHRAIERRDKIITSENIRKIFGDEINSLIYGDNDTFQKVLTNYPDFHRQIEPQIRGMELLYSRSLDSGFLREIHFKDDVASAVCMLNKNAFIYELISSIEKTDRKTTVLIFDIQDVRLADRVTNINDEGNIEHYADMTLQLVAQKAQLITEEINEANENDYSNTKKRLMVKIGRLGGDEYGVLLEEIDGNDPNVINSVENKYIEGMSEIDTRVVQESDDGKITGIITKKVGIKNGRAYRISVPEENEQNNNLSKRVWEYYARRGMLLSEEISEGQERSPLQECVDDIQINMSALEEDEAFENLRKDPNRFKNEDDIDDAFKQLLGKDPEFYYYYKMAESLDMLESSIMQSPEIIFHRRKKIYEHFELKMRNRLLNMFTYKRGEIYERMQNDAFEFIVSIKVPLMKENNDGGNMPRTDKTLYAVGEKIEDILKTLSTQERANIAICNEGPVFLVCIRNKDLCTPETLKAIQAINEIQPFSDNDVKIPIGNTSHDIQNLQKDGKPLDEIFNQMIREAENDCLMKFLQIVDQDVSLYKRLLDPSIKVPKKITYPVKKETVFDDTLNTYITKIVSPGITQEEYLQRYWLSEKRRSERLNDVITFFQDEKNWSNLKHPEEVRNIFIKENNPMVAA